MESKKVLKKTLKILLNVFVWLFILLCVVGVFVTVTGQKTGDGTTEVFGMQLRVVTSSSMEENDFKDVSDYDIEDIPVRSMVFVDTVPDDPYEKNVWYGELEVGDVLTYSYMPDEAQTPIIITHRIVYIKCHGDGDYEIHLQGDNRTSEDGGRIDIIRTSKKKTFDYVIGKVVWQSYPLGLFVTVLREPVGLVCMVIVPAAVIALWEIIKIIGMFTSDKRKKEREKSEEQKNELDALKRRLAELEAAQKNAEINSDTNGREP